MLKGMKSQRQLAAFVALAVGGAFAGLPAAYAAQSTTVGTNDTRLTGTGTSLPTAYQGVSGTALLNGMVTDNTITIGTAGTTYLPFVTGDVSAGGTAATSTAVTGNTLVINNISLTGNAYGGIGLNIAQTAGAAPNNPNVVKMNGGAVTGSVVGARSAAGGVTNGGAELAGGTVTAGTDGVALAGGRGQTSAINNVVTITGGSVKGTIYGGYADNSGAKTTGNNVYLGDSNGTYTPNLSQASLYGGNDSDYKNNHLHVRAKNITADSANNFNTYDFHLNTGISAGDMMLTLTNNNDALGRTVNWSEINLDATGWSGKGVNAQNQSVQNYFGDVGTVTLMADGNTATNRSSNLRLSNALGRTGWDGDYEYHIGLRTEPNIATSTTRDYVDAELHRYQNANHIHTGALSGRNTIYGGYSIWVNKVVQDNDLTLNNATGFTKAYGGFTSTGADAVRNKLTLNSGTVGSLYGGVAAGAGLVDDNHVIVNDGTVTANIDGGRSTGTGRVTKNTVIVNKGTVNTVTGGSGRTEVAGNSVTISGGATANPRMVYPVVKGEVAGGRIQGNDSTTRSASKNTVTITEGDVRDTVYGVFGTFFYDDPSNPTKNTTQTVTENSVDISGGAAKDIYGAYLTGSGTSTGIGTASKNSVKASGTADIGGSIYGAGAYGNANLTDNSVSIEGAAVNNVYGAYATGTGSATGNTVNISNGTVHDNVYGGYNSSTGYDAGAVTGSKASVSGGRIEGDIFGAVTHGNVDPTGTIKPTSSGGNSVTITGGTIAGGYRPDGTLRGNIYGGYAHGTNVSVETENTVTLGKDDDTYEKGTDLINATIYGGASRRSGNTLNIKAKDTAVKGVHNFENYKFFLTDKVSAGDTMLTLTDHNGFENHYSGTTRVDFTKVGIDLTNMSSKQIAGQVTLIEGAHDNALQFRNYTPRGEAAPTATNGDYEYSLRLTYGNDNTEADVNAMTGRRVLLDYNRFQNGNEAYNATGTKTEWFAGRSYGGHTTKKNTLTINADLGRDITAYGAQTLGTSGGSTGNTVNIQSTGTNNAYQVTAAYGGYIGHASNADAVTGNTLTLTGGTVGTLYGGYSAGTGEVSGNNTLVTGGTVKGDIYAGWAAGAGKTKDNVLTLGAQDGKYSATIEGELYGGNDTAGTGNTLVVRSGSEVSVKKVHNFHNYTFILQNNDLIDKTLLRIRETGGLGNTVTWGNISVDASKFSINPSWMGSHSVTLIESNGQMTFSGYTATDLTQKYPNDPYEIYLHTDREDTTNGTASQLLLTVNRLKDGSVNYDGTDAKIVGDEVFTGRSAMGYDVTGNKLLLTGVQTGGIAKYAAAGVATGSAGKLTSNLTNNAVTINSANPLSITEVYGAYADHASISGNLTSNSVTLTRGALTGNIYGAKSLGSGGVGGSGTANTVTITGGSVTGDIYGGFSGSGAADYNVVDLSQIEGLKITGSVIGGQGATATNNVINLRGTDISGYIYGGRLAGGTPSATATDANTLNIHDMGAKAHYFEGIQNINFYLSPKADLAKSMLTLDAPLGKDLHGTNFNVAIEGGYAPLRQGDVVSLIKLPNTQHIATDTIADITATQGVTMDYTFGFETRNTQSSSSLIKNEFVAHVKDAKVKSETKTLVETQSASIAFLTSGSDLLTDVGIPAAETAAMQIADIVDAPLADSKKTNATKAPLSSLGSYQLFAAQSYGNMRLKTGSHVDAKGWNLNVGYARRSELLSSSLTFGPFIEYGSGTYDSYLDDGTHGDGKTSYFGVGIMAKSEKDNGTYIEGSLRVGKAKSDYSGTIGKTATGYDTSSSYFAGHLGIGQKKEFDNGNKFETYAKYFYAHQAGTSAKLASGENYDFNASTSSRIRLGTRYTFKNDLDGEFYAGLAWEYEFDAESTASYQGAPLPGTSLKGGTTLFELGYRFAPADSTVTYGLNLTGYAGKRKGITGGFNIAWGF